MLLLSLMASSHTGCFPGFVLHREQPISKSFKDFPHLLPTTGSRQDISRSSILSWTPHEQDDLFKSTSELSGYSRFVRTAPIRRIPQLVDVQDKQIDHILFSFGIDEQWRKHKKLLQFLMSGANDLEYLDPSTFPNLVSIQSIHTTPADRHPLHLARTDMEFNNFSGEDTSLLHPSGNYHDLETNSNLAHDRPPTVLVDADGRLSFVGDMTSMKDLVFVLDELKYMKDLTWRKQVLVPNFRWNGALDVHGDAYMSSLKLESLTVAPLKSLEKVKVKRSTKRKSKRATQDRALYKNNPLPACEMLLSIMMDKNRTVKSVTNSLRKAGPELPLLLTQFSASITGTGLAVMFSLILKVACGSILFCTPNLLTSVFGIGLFTLSSAVNKLRDTLIYIAKTSTKIEFEGEEIMVKVNKGVNDIFFRVAALLAVLILRFS